MGWFSNTMNVFKYICRYVYWFVSGYVYNKIINEF